MEKSLIQINSELREELKETVKKEFRNEKILMFFIIYFIFLRKDLTLENILSM